MILILQLKVNHNMNTIEANIEITRANDKLVSISVSMPVWSKESEFDGNIHVHLPLLDIDTIASDEKDAEFAIKEAIQSFCIASEKFGEGLEKELQALGWKQVYQVVITFWVSVYQKLTSFWIGFYKQATTILTLN